MSYWGYREQLSLANKLRRSYYELLRDEFDQNLLRYALVDSYANFRMKKRKYPFVEKRELKPRARIPDVEYDCHHTFLVIFLEDSLLANHKKYIHFLDVNKTTKTNLLQSKTLPLKGNFDRYQKYLFENKICKEDELLEIQQQVEKEIEEGVQFAQESPEPPDEALFEHIYVETSKGGA